MRRALAAHPVLEYTDGTVTVTVGRGTASNVPFQAPVLSPCTWNGSLCYQVPPAVGDACCQPAVVHSTGSPARLAALGSPIAVDNRLTRIAYQLPPEQFGDFLASPNAGFLPFTGGSQGNLCLDSPIGRDIDGAFQSGTGGFGSRRIDLAQVPTPTGTVALVSGDTWHFTCWYRDANPGPTSNFTGAVEVQLE